MRTKYLPPGTLTSARKNSRRRGWIEGALIAVMAIALMGFAFIAMQPAELYRPVSATPNDMALRPVSFERVPIPPCLGEGKDCTEVETLKQRPATPIPEPSSLWLLIAGAAAMVRERILALCMIGFVLIGRLFGMQTGDE